MWLAVAYREARGSDASVIPGRSIASRRGPRPELRWAAEHTTVFSCCQLELPQSSFCCRSRAASQTTLGAPGFGRASRDAARVGGGGEWETQRYTSWHVAQPRRLKGIRVGPHRRLWGNPGQGRAGHGDQTTYIGQPLASPPPGDSTICQVTPLQGQAQGSTQLGATRPFVPLRGEGTETVLSLGLSVCSFRASGSGLGRGEAGRVGAGGWMVTSLGRQGEMHGV